MKKGLVVSDSGPIFSLALIDMLGLLDGLFNEIYIPNAVWEELTKDKSKEHYNGIVEYFEGKVKKVSGINELRACLKFHQ